MSTSDTRPRHHDPLTTAVARGWALVAAVVVLGVVWFGCRFIVPRYEASLMDVGLRPSAAARGLLIASHYISRYFWGIAPILGALFVISSKSRPGSRGDRP